MFSIGEIVNRCGFNGKEEGIKFVSKEFPFKYDNNNQSFNIDDFNKIKMNSKQRKKYQNYEDRYLKESKEKGAFKEIDNIELIYIAPKSENMDYLYKEKGVKHITFENLYEDMEFNEEYENINWNSIKDIFKFIEINS